eukprot:355667-Amphidinium_carterae.3
MDCGPHLNAQIEGNNPVGHSSLTATFPVEMSDSNATPDTSCSHTALHHTTPVHYHCLCLIV